MILLKIIIMAEFKIRFNTEHKGSEMKWRVLIDSEEFLAKSITINCKSTTSQDWVTVNDFPCIKYHISCKSENFEWNEEKDLIIN